MKKRFKVKAESGSRVGAPGTTVTGTCTLGASVDEADDPARRTDDAPAAPSSSGGSRRIVAAGLGSSPTDKIGREKDTGPDSSSKE
jgi:hypothetical protein